MVLLLEHTLKKMTRRTEIYVLWKCHFNNTLTLQNEVHDFCRPFYSSYKVTNVHGFSLNSSNVSIPAMISINVNSQIHPIPPISYQIAPTQFSTTMSNHCPRGHMSQMPQVCPGNVLTLFWYECLFFGVTFVNEWPVSRHIHVKSTYGNIPLYSGRTTEV